MEFNYIRSIAGGVERLCNPVFRLRMLTQITINTYSLKGVGTKNCIFMFSFYVYPCMFGALSFNPRFETLLIWKSLTSLCFTLEQSNRSLRQPSRTCWMSHIIVSKRESAVATFSTNDTPGICVYVVGVIIWWIIKISPVDFYCYGHTVIFNPWAMFCESTMAMSVAIYCAQALIVQPCIEFHWTIVYNAIVLRRSSADLS